MNGVGKKGTQSALRTSRSWLPTHHRHLKAHPWTTIKNCSQKLPTVNWLLFCASTILYLDFIVTLFSYTYLYFCFLYPNQVCIMHQQYGVLLIQCLINQLNALPKLGLKAQKGHHSYPRVEVRLVTCFIVLQSSLWNQVKANRTNDYSIIVVFSVFLNIIPDVFIHSCKETLVDY